MLGLTATSQANLWPQHRILYFQIRVLCTFFQGVFSRAVADAVVAHLLLWTMTQISFRSSGSPKIVPRKMPEVLGSNTATISRC